MGGCRNSILVFVSDRSRSGLAKKLVQILDSLGRCVAVNKNRLFLDGCVGIRGHSSLVSLEEMIRPSPISSRSTMAGTLTRQQKKNVRLVMFLILLACYHNSIRVRSFLLRAALVPPSLSPWRKLYDEGDC